MNNELYHHGILGQKWGVRRFQNKDGTYTAEGKKRRANNISQKDDSVAILLGVIGMEVAVGLSSVAISKGKQAVKNMRSNKALDEEIKSRFSEEIDPETGLRLKPEQFPLEEDVKHINPGFDPSVPGASNNCTYCAIAAEVRRRGYDVSAGRINTKALGMKPEDMRDKYYPDAKEKLLGLDGVKLVPLNKTKLKAEFENDDVKKIFNQERAASLYGSNYEGAKRAIKNLEKEVNSSGVLSLKWGFGGGHSTSYEVKNGKLTIIEGQTGKIYSGDQAEQYLAAACIFTGYRLDNVKINYEALKKDGVIR